MDQPTSPSPENENPNADLDVQRTREMMAFLGQGGTSVSPVAPTFDFQDSAPQETSPFNPNAMTGKDYYEFFQQNRSARFNHDAQGRQAFNMMAQYMDQRKVDFLGSAEMAVGQMVEELGGLAEAPLDPRKLAASTAEGAAKGLRDMYGIFSQSEDPNSAFFKIKSWAMRLAGKDDGDLDSQMRQFHEARTFNNASYEYMEGKSSIVGEMLPEGYGNMFSKLVEPKFATALSYAVLDIPEIVLSSGMSTPATALKLAALRAPKAAAKGGAYAAWAARSSERLSNYAQVMGGKALEATGAVVKAPFKAIYGASQSAAQLGGDFAGNAVRNMATAEVIEAGAELIGGTVVRHPAMGFLRSFGLEAFGELAQTAGADIADRALGRVSVKMDTLGATTLERLAAGTAKGADVMSREAQLLAKGINASVGWAPSLSGQALKTMFRDGIIGAGLGWANSGEEGAGMGLGMGIGWGGLSGSIRHLHAYTHYTHQDKRVVQNFNQFVAPSFSRIHGATAGEMARRFGDHVQSFGDLRTSAIEMSHLSTLVAHETGLFGEGNVMFFFGNSAAEFDKMLLDSNVGPGDFAKVSQEFYKLGQNPAMMTEVTLNNKAVKRIIAINSDAYRPTSARHEISHLLLRSVAEANGDMDHVYFPDPVTGQRRSGGKVFSPRYLSTIYGASKDMGMMPDMAWGAALQQYVAQIEHNRGMASTDQAAVYTDAQAAGLAAKDHIAKFRDLYNNGTLDMRNPDHIDIVRDMTLVAEEAYAYYQSATSNVFAVDKYVKDPAARNMLRAWAENRAASNNSRILSDLELAGVELRGKLINPDGSAKLFDDQGNPAMETMVFDDGKVLRLKAMDSWIEQTMKSAYSRGEVHVSSMDPMRQAALAKTSGKEHLFTAVSNGGMKLKTKQELDELSLDQSKKIIGAIGQLPENVRPLVQVGADGTQRLILEQMNGEGLEALRASGAFTDREFNELIGMIEIAKRGREGVASFNVMNTTLLAHSMQVRRGASVFRLRGDDVPVTYRTFVPLSVEVYLKTQDVNGDPLRTPKGGVVVHSLDVAAENRRLTKMFKRGDVQQLFSGNFDDFVKVYQDYVINQSGLNGPRVPSAELFKPRFGTDAERVRDIMYETFGGRKPKDAPFVNTPSNGYMGGADDTNRPFYTMRFDTMADTRLHPTSWNARSNLPLFPYMPSAYEGITRNFQLSGFQKLPLAGGANFLRDRNGFEIYEGKKGFNLFDMYGIKVGTFSSIKSAMAKAAKDIGKYDEADILPAEEGHTVEINGKSEEFLFPATPVFQLHGVRDRAHAILSANAKAPDFSVSEQILSSIVGSEYKLDQAGRLIDESGNVLLDQAAEARKGFTVKAGQAIPGAGFKDTVRIGIGHASAATDFEAVAQNEAVRVSPSWLRALIARPGGKDIADRQMAARLAIAENIARGFRAGELQMPSANSRQSSNNFAVIADAMPVDGSDFSRIEADMDSWLLSQKATINTVADQIEGAFGISAGVTSAILPFHDVGSSDYVPQRVLHAAHGVVITPALMAWAKASGNSKVAAAGGTGAIELIRAHAEMTGQNEQSAVIQAATTGEFAALIRAGGTPNEWLQYHETVTPGFTAEFQALLPIMERAKNQPSATVLRGKVSLPLAHPDVKLHIKNFVDDARFAASQDGPYRKTVTSEVGKNGNLKLNDTGKKEGVLFTALLNISDPRMENFLSHESIYRAIAIASDPKNYAGLPAGARASDMAKLQLLIHAMQSEDNVFHHEIKTTSERTIGIKGKWELTGGPVPSAGSYNIYSGAPSLAPMPGKLGRQSGGRISIQHNVNHQTPGRFRQVLESRGSMIKDGVLTLISGDALEKTMTPSISKASYILSTSSDSRMRAADGKAKPTISPSKMTGLTDGAQVPGDVFYNPADRSISPMAFGLAVKTRSSSGVPNMVRAAHDAGYTWLGKHMSKADVSELRPFVEQIAQIAMGTSGEWRIADPADIAPIMAQLTEHLEQVMPHEKVVFAEDIILGIALSLVGTQPRPSSFTYDNAGNIMPKPATSLGRADAIAGMSKIAQAIHQAEYIDGSVKSATNIKEKWIDYSKRARDFLKSGTIELKTKEVPAGIDWKTDPVFMLAGKRAIERLDADRKDLLKDLGLLGRAKDVLGREFDYLEISDSRAKLLTDRFGGRAAMMAADGMTDPDAAIKAAVAEFAAGRFDGPAGLALVANANSNELALGQIFSHDELFALYPGMKSSKVTFELGAFGATYYGEGSFGRIELGIGMLLRDELAAYDAEKGISSEYVGSYVEFKGTGGISYDENLRRTIIHEVQHMVYHAEGWSQIWDWNLTDNDTGEFDKSEMVFAGPAALTRIEQMLGGTELTPITDSFGPSIDATFVSKLRHMQVETSRILSFDPASKTIRKADDATATQAIERIIHAPLAAKMVRDVIPETVRWTQALDGTFHMLASSLRSQKEKLSVEAYNSAMEKLNSSADALSKFTSVITVLESELKAGRKTAHAASFELLNELDQNRHFLMLEDPSWSALYAGMGGGFEHQLRTMAFRDKANLWRNLLEAHEDLGGRGGKMPGDWAQWHMVKIANAMGRMMYFAQPDELNARVTEARAGMSQQQLAKQNRYMPKADKEIANAYNVGRYIAEVAMTGAMRPFDDTLFMIGGAKGSEQFDANMFGGGTPNTFKLGMRMLARSSLLSHYINIRDVGSAMRVLTFSSRGWRIGADGKPEFVFSMGRLQGADEWGRDVATAANTGISRIVNNAIDFYRDFEDPEALPDRAMALTAQPDQIARAAELNSVSEETIVKQNAFEDLIKANRFINPTDYDDNRGPGFGLLAGLSKDGESVKIEDVAKALGATIAIDSLVTMQSPVLNAIHEGKVPLLMTGGGIVDYFRMAGVDENGIELAKLSQIDKHFAGIKLSAGELAELVAVMHDVPFESVVEAPLGAKAIAVQSAMADKQLPTKLRELSRGWLPTSTMATRMSTWVNEVLSSGQSQSNQPLKSLFQTETTERAGSGVMFLQNMIETQIKLSWNGNEFLSKMLSAERFAKVREKFLNSDTREIVFKHVQSLANSQSSFARRAHSERALLAFASRVERLLIELTPLAEKLAERIIKSADNDGGYAVELLGDIYGESIKEAMKDVSSYSASDRDISIQEPGFAVRRSMDIRVGAGAQDVNALGSSYEKVAAHSLGMTAPRANNSIMLPAFGMIGGATEAFSRTASGRARYLGMAGMSTAPVAGLDTFTGSFSKNAAREYARGVNLSAGPGFTGLAVDMGALTIGINMFGEPYELTLDHNADGAISITPESFYTGIGQDLLNLGATSRPGNISNQITRAGLDPAVAAASDAANRLISMAKQLSEVIVSQNTNHNLDVVSSAIYEAVSIDEGSSEIRRFVKSDPSIARAFEMGDLSGDLLKAKALLAAAYEVADRPDMNVGMANSGMQMGFSRDWGYYSQGASEISRTVSSYRPLSQTSVVRTHVTPEGRVVLTSAFEGLADSRDIRELRVIDAITGSGSVSAHEVAHKPTIEMMAQWHTSMNLFADNEHEFGVNNFDQAHEADLTVKSMGSRVRSISEIGLNALKNIPINHEFATGFMKEVGYKYGSSWYARNLVETLTGETTMDIVIGRLNASGSGINLAASLQSVLQEKQFFGTTSKAFAASHDRSVFFQPLARYVWAAAATLGIRHFSDGIKEPHKSVLLGMIARGDDTQAIKAFIGGTPFTGFREGSVKFGKGTSHLDLSQIHSLAGNMMLKERLMPLLEATGVFRAEDIDLIKRHIDHATAFDPTSTGDIRLTGRVVDGYQKAQGARDITPGHQTTAGALLAFSNLKSGLLTNGMDLGDNGDGTSAIIDIMKGLARLEGRKPRFAMDATEGVRFIFPEQTGVDKAGATDGFLSSYPTNSFYAVASDTVGNPGSVIGVNTGDRPHALGKGSEMNLDGTNRYYVRNAGASVIGYEPIPPEQGGALAAMMGVPLFSDFKYSVTPGLMTVTPDRTGRSKLSSSVMRTAMVESIIAELRKENAKTIDIAPAGHHLSYIGADPMMLASATQSEAIKDITATWNNKGLKGINRTLQSAYRHGDEMSGVVNASVVTHSLYSEQGGPYGKNIPSQGMGQTTGPDQLGEFAPKKGYAWQRLPDGRIMLNVTGDHLGYKLDHKQITKRRPGYGFSLIEGLGWDQQNGVLMPMRINAHVGVSDMLRTMKHPLAAMFDHTDPAVIGQHIRAAASSNRRNFHETRGNFGPMTGSFSDGARLTKGIKDFEFISGYLADNAIDPMVRADVAAQLNGHQSANGYASIILPANATPDDIRSAVLALHMEPIIGLSLSHMSNHSRRYSHLEFTGDNAYSKDRSLPTRNGMAPSTEGYRYSFRGAMPGRLPAEVLKGLMDTTMMLSPTLIDDIDAMIGKMSGGESGYFLPDSERILSMNGDTGLAIASMFPGRPDLLRYSWDSKNMHGIKVWKRTIPKGAEKYHAHVVQFEAPMQYEAEGGLRIGPKSIAFRTAEEATAFANRVSVSRSGADIAKALAAGDVEVVNGADTPTSPFMPEADVRKGVFINGQELTAMENSAHFVGDMDTPMDKKSARTLGAALGSNKHLRFAPGESLMMVGGKSMDELQDLVRCKLNFGAPRGTMEFASKAMNAIIHGALPNTQKLEAMLGEDWFKVMKKAGVSGEEMRQTGLAALFIGAKTTKLTRMDVAEFMAATIPMLRRHDLSTSNDLKLAGILAMGGGLEGGDSPHKLNGGYMMPYMPDSVLQSRINQHQAISGIIGSLEKLELTHRALLESGNSNSEMTLNAIAATNKVLLSYAKKIGMGDEATANKGASELATLIQSRIESLAKKTHTGDDKYSNLNYSGLENVRLTMNDHISNIRALQDVSSMVGGVMPELVLPLRQLHSEFMMGSQAMELPTRFSTGTAPYGWSSSTVNKGVEDLTGQVISGHYNKYWGSYTSGYQHIQTQAAVRFGDKYATEQIDGYLTQLRATNVAELRKEAPDRGLIERNDLLIATAKRVLTVRTALKKIMQANSSTGHFASLLPGSNPNLGGQSGVHEIGHSRFSQSFAVSGLSIEGFADPLGFSGAMYSGTRDYALTPLAFPITLLEEIQSDFAQKINGVGVDKNMDVYLPLNPEEEASLASVPEYEKMVSKAAELRALAESVTGFVTDKLVVSMLTPRGNRSTGVGSSAALNLFLRLQLDQTDILNRGILAVQVPGLLRGTGREVKAPESLKASLRGKFQLELPDKVPSMEFDHELIAKIAEYQTSGFTNVPEAVADSIAKRLADNIRSTDQWNNTFGRKIGGQGTDAAIAAVTGEPHRSMEMIRQNLLQIMTRGQEQMQEQHAVLKSVAIGMRSFGDNSDLAAFVEALANIADTSRGDLGAAIGCELAGMAILDESVAMNVGAYARGEYKFDYESIARSALERIRARYTDTKTFTGKTILLAFEEMLRTPAEERPFISIADGLSEPKEVDAVSNMVTDLASVFRTSDGTPLEIAERLMTDPANTLPSAIQDNLTSIAEFFGTGGNLYVQNANSGGILSEGNKRTYRVFRSLEEGGHEKTAYQLLAHFLERASEGHDLSKINAVEAQYHRHVGSLAGDFVKQVIEVYAGMSKRAEYAVEAEAIEAKAREVKKTIPEVGSYREDGMAPATLPYAGENSYKSMQLQMSIMDSMNRGQRGVGIMDASWQLTRGHGLSEQAVVGIGIGINKRVAWYNAGPSSAMQTILACYERMTGLNPNDAGGINSGLLHRLGQMTEAETQAAMTGMAFDHDGSSRNLHGHVLQTFELMLDRIRTNISEDSYRALAKDILEFAGTKGIKDFNYSLKNGHQNGAAFVEGKKNPNHPNWADSTKFIANGMKDVSLATMPQHNGSGGWGYITNYGLPQHKADIMLAGTSKLFRSQYSLDAFERPAITVEGTTMSMFDTKSGKLIASVDVRDAAQVKMFRERYLQSSKYVGGNWMVRAFLKEWAPVGGYVDLTVSGSTATNKPELGSFAWDESINSSATMDQVIAATRRKYASGQATILDNSAQLNTPQYAASTNAIEAAGGVAWGGEIAPPKKFTFGGESESMRQPASTTVNPLAPGVMREGRSSYGTTGNPSHVRALVDAFAGFARNPGADEVAAFAARMRDPVITTLIHTPEGRTKEMDMQFRRKMTEGVFLLMAAGERPRGGKISQTGFASLNATVRNRELMPITYARNVLVDRLELPPLDKAPFMAPRDLEDKRKRVFDREKAVELMKQGYPDTQISSHLGVDRVSILNMRKNAGIAPLNEGRVRGSSQPGTSDDVIAHYAQAKDSGVTWKALQKQEGKKLGDSVRAKIKVKRKPAKPDGSNPMPTDSLSDPQHPNQIRPTESSPKSNMAKLENMEREMNE